MFRLRRCRGPRRVVALLACSLSLSACGRGPRPSRTAPPSRRRTRRPTTTRTRTGPTRAQPGPTSAGRRGRARARARARRPLGSGDRGPADRDVGRRRRRADHDARALRQDQRAAPRRVVPLHRGQARHLRRRRGQSELHADRGRQERVRVPDGPRLADHRAAPRLRGPDRGVRDPQQLHQRFFKENADESRRDHRSRVDRQAAAPSSCARS